MEPPQARVSGVQTIFHVISLITGIIHDSIPVFLDRLLLVFLVQQIGPRLDSAGKRLFALVSHHSAEHIRPCAGNDFRLLVKLHTPETGIHSGMNIVHGRFFLLDLGISRSDFVSVRLLLFQGHTCILSKLQDEPLEHSKHRCHRNNNLNHATTHHTGADGIDLFGYNIIPDQNRHHPVCPFHRNVAQILGGTFIMKSNLSLPSLREITLQLLIAESAINISLLHFREEIGSRFQISKIIICQIFTRAMVQTPVSLIVVCL